MSWPVFNSVQEAFAAFEPQMVKLHKEHNSICEIWWSSRWSDWINLVADDKDWAAKTAAYKFFADAWKLFKDRFTKGFFQPEEIKPPVPVAVQLKLFI
jgi:hypothetical protein